MAASSGTSTSESKATAASESTGTGEIEDAEAILIKRIRECRDAVAHSIRPRRLFREAATEYLTRHAHRRGISRDATGLQNLDPYIGGKRLEEIYDETFNDFREARAKEGLCIGSVDRDIGSAARVLEEAAKKYRDERTKLTWLRELPYINYSRPYKSGSRIRSIGMSNGCYSMNWPNIW